MVAIFDTGIALLAGMIIFPAVFAFGMAPGAGPSLIFITLPQVFAQMPLGNLVGTTFFFLVFIAALTSAISILEGIVTYLVDDANIRRHIATSIAAVLVFLVGIPACLSAHEGGALGTWKIPFIGGGLSFFDLMDTLTSKFMMPLGGFVLCLFFAIRWGQENALAAVPGTNGNPRSLALKLWYYCLIIVSPLGILAVLIAGVWELLHKT
jgi:NSS family neurotransmitter:Na+ symporter